MIRPASPRDLAVVHALNEASLPHVSSIELRELERLGSIAAYFRVVEHAGEVAGFLLAMRPEAPYESVNFLWFKARYPNFLYIDRIVIAEAHRGQRLGWNLYADVETFAREIGVPALTCEVNLRPPNPDSLRFHTRYGF